MSAPVPTLKVHSSLFEGMSEEQRRAVLNAATVRRLMSRTVVVHQQSPADTLYLLVKGCARHFLITPEGKKSILMWLPPGSLFGAAAMISRPTDYLVSTETVVDSCVAVWPRDKIRALIETYPILVENGLLVASDYVAYFLNVYLKQSAKQRLARVIATLAQSIGEHTSAGVLLDVTNEELASAADVTIYTASRIISRWRRNGVVAKNRGRLLLRALDSVKREASDSRYFTPAIIARKQSGR